MGQISLENKLNIGPTLSPLPVLYAND